MKRILILACLIASLTGCSDGQLDVESVRWYQGYAESGAKLTSCGTCHQDIQSTWLETAHAGAWETLTDYSADERDDCQPCHVVGFDASASNGGFDDVAAAGGDSLRLVDVQCEACHHFFDNHTGTPPVVLPPPVDVCNDCHSGPRYPYLDDLELSGMYYSNLAAGGYAATGEECESCHTSDGFLTSIGVTGYGTGLDYQVTCFACHDPHSAALAQELRYAVEESQLCSMCHSADGLSPGDQVHHSQASMLFGTDGYEYSGESYSNSIHAVAGPIVEGGCPTCHMVKRSVAGETGHGFTPSLRSCTPCHGRLKSFNVDGVQDEIEGLLDELKALLDSAQVESEAYKRAQYNYQFVMRDGSLGVHNYEYAKKLLEDSIDDAPYDN